MSKLTETAPKTIYLCISDEPEDADTPYPELYAEDAEITWATDQPVAVTVEYTRADICEAQLNYQLALLQKANESNEKLRFWIQTIRGLARAMEGQPQSIVERCTKALDGQ